MDENLIAVSQAKADKLAAGRKNHALGTWKKAGGSEVEFEKAWPEMHTDMLKAV